MKTLSIDIETYSDQPLAKDIAATSGISLRDLHLFPLCSVSAQDDSLFPRHHLIVGIFFQLLQIVIHRTSGYLTGSTDGFDPYRCRLIQKKVDDLFFFAHHIIHQGSPCCLPVLTKTGCPQTATISDRHAQRSAGCSEKSPDRPVRSSPKRSTGDGADVHTLSS